MRDYLDTSNTDHTIISALWPYPRNGYSTFYFILLLWSFLPFSKPPLCWRVVSWWTSVHRIDCFVPSKVILAPRWLNRAFESTAKLAAHLGSVVWINVGVPIIRLDKMSGAIITIKASDVDVFVPFTTVETKIHDVYVTQFSSQVIRSHESISIKVARGSNVRWLSSRKVHP